VVTAVSGGAVVVVDVVLVEVGRGDDCCSLVQAAPSTIMVVARASPTRFVRDVTAGSPSRPGR
jgi:hypothetical protein